MAVTVSKKLDKGYYSVSELITLRWLPRYLSSVVGIAEKDIVVGDESIGFSKRVKETLDNVERGSLNPPYMIYTFSRDYDLSSDPRKWWSAPGWGEGILDNSGTFMVRFTPVLMSFNVFIFTHTWSEARYREWTLVWQRTADTLCKVRASFSYGENDESFGEVRIPVIVGINDGFAGINNVEEYINKLQLVIVPFSMSVYTFTLQLPNMTQSTGGLFNQFEIRMLDAGLDNVYDSEIVGVSNDG